MLLHLWLGTNFSSHVYHNPFSQRFCNSKADSLFTGKLEGDLGTDGGLEEDGSKEFVYVLELEVGVKDERWYLRFFINFSSCNLVKSTACMSFIGCKA